MAKKQETAKSVRIDAEEKRLRKIYKDLSAEAMGVLDGLIRRAAYMRATLEDYEHDLDEKGYVELFRQSDEQEPYERERPVARLYNAMNKNYQSIIKQLNDTLPSDMTKAQTADALASFITQRPQVRAAKP